MYPKALPYLATWCTCFLNCSKSGLEIVSALAITGIMFTLESNSFIHAKSSDFNLKYVLKMLAMRELVSYVWPVGLMK